MARTAKPANQKVAALITRPPDRHPSVLFSFGFFLFFNFSNERHARWWSISAATAATTTTTTDAGLGSLGNAIRRDPAPCVGPPSAHTHPRRIRSVGQGLLRWKSRKEKKTTTIGQTRTERRGFVATHGASLCHRSEKKNRKKGQPCCLGGRSSKRRQDRLQYGNTYRAEPQNETKEQNKKKQTKRSPLDWTEGDR